MARIGAIDLGSGTIKLSIFESQGRSWSPLCLEELNTELRRGMGPDNLLQEEPVAASLRAVQHFLALSKTFRLERLPVYGTSALRRAKNAEKLLEPLKALGLGNCRILSEAEEGRWNLLGTQVPAALVADPGGDSTDLAWGETWQDAKTASLPFGSVSLQEAFGQTLTDGPIHNDAIQALQSFVEECLDDFEPARELRASRREPAIRVNLPIEKALRRFRIHDESLGEEHSRFELKSLKTMLKKMASMGHADRVALIPGEPVGKVDRTPFGLASWVALLEWMDAPAFFCEGLGIKLGAALALNGYESRSPL